MKQAMILNVTDATLQQAASALKQGELVAFPTETVYGLGAIVSNTDAIERVFEAKGRSRTNPVNLTVASKEMAQAYVHPLDEKTEQLMAAFWPGPLTLVLKRRMDRVPNIVTAGQDTVALRMPKQSDTLRLIEYVGEPIVGPSANTSGRPSPTLATHVAHDLGEQVTYILDGGQSALGIESTIIDLSSDRPVILRVGEITREAIESVIGPIEVNQAQAPASQRPHYQPDTPVYRLKGTAEDIVQQLHKCSNRQIALALPEELFNVLENSGQIDARLYNMGATVKTYKQQLYNILRQVDEESFDAIILYEVEETAESSSLVQRIRLISESFLNLP
ncbi:L-threonylcarbamoyladenylate synthase [Atopobacter phocae]|uniref:L-threonylcarbamoyladenylate synthase n=1 Tax=Atopobacter phocae TaxID=136492 RepID=UPI0004AEAE5F|nr:L-threonylcarbamoyladenylate synthase [Atopobacter phocae]